MYVCMYACECTCIAATREMVRMCMFVCKCIYVYIYTSMQVARPAIEAEDERQRHTFIHTCMRIHMNSSAQVEARTAIEAEGERQRHAYIHMYIYTYTHASICTGGGSHRN
jgi:hypothetical protein